MKRILTIVIMIILAAGFVQAQTPEILPITWSWTAPTVGTEVVTYEGEMKWVFASDLADTFTAVWFSSTADTTFTTDYAAGSFITVRVRGKDERLVVGEYSQWAEWFIYYGKPGQPLDPVFIRLGEEPINP